jgi:hypothetical protein
MRVESLWTRDLAVVIQSYSSVDEITSNMPSNTQEVLGLNAKKLLVHIALLPSGNHRKLPDRCYNNNAIATPLGARASNGGKVVD